MQNAELEMDDIDRNWFKYLKLLIKHRVFLHFKKY
jgi:hypothetical protein